MVFCESIVTLWFLKIRVVRISQAPISTKEEQKKRTRKIIKKLIKKTFVSQKKVNFQRTTTLLHCEGGSRGNSQQHGGEWTFQ